MAFSPYLGQAANVVLTIGDGSGAPGSSGNPVVVSLDNPNDKVKGVQVDVCDVDDYLACTGCETTNRTTGFSCTAEEHESGCCRVLLFDFGGGSINEGEEPIFTLSYDVSGEAPTGECRELSTEEEKVSDENQQPLEVTSESGEFCFLTSSTTTTTTITPITISPHTLWKSRWVPLPYLMTMEGSETHFVAFDTSLDFQPPKAVFACFPLVWDNSYIWDLVWVMPVWLAGVEDQTVTVTVTTENEVVEGNFMIKLLPAPLILDQK